MVDSNSSLSSNEDDNMGEVEDDIEEGEEDIKMASMTSSNTEECKLKKFDNFDYPSSCSSPGGLHKREKSYKGKKQQKKFILEGIKEEQDSSDNSE